MQKPTAEPMPLPEEDQHRRQHVIALPNPFRQDELQEPAATSWFGAASEPVPEPLPSPPEMQISGSTSSIGVRYTAHERIRRYDCLRLVNGEGKGSTSKELIAMVSESQASAELTLERPTVIQLRVKRNGSKLGLAVAASKSHLGLLVRGVDANGSILKLNEAQDVDYIAPGDRSRGRIVAINGEQLSSQQLAKQLAADEYELTIFRYNESNIRAAFETSLSSGVTLLNTAQIYYTSEDCIGLGGKSWAFALRTSSPSGSKALVISKFDALSNRTTDLVPTLQRSIEKCKVDALDGFLIHFPKGSPEAVADQLAVAYQRGLVRNVGVSNYDEAALRQMHGLLMRGCITPALRKDRGVPLIFNEIEFSLLRRMPETSGLLKVCKELGVTVLAWAPLASGRLTSKPCTEQITDSDTVACLEQVKTLAAKYQKTPAQVALNWCICKGTVPIPGARTLEQAQENAGALGWQLTAEEVAQLDAVAVDSLGMYNSPEALYTFFGWCLTILIQVQIAMSRAQMVDLRLINNFVVPWLFGGDARIDWAHPVLALDQLEELTREAPEQLKLLGPAPKKSVQAPYAPPAGGRCSTCSACCPPLWYGRPAPALEGT
eukprot:g9637.t1